MKLDVKQLEQDLQELRQKKEQAAERLRNLAPRFARGRGGHGGPAQFGGRFGAGTQPLRGAMGGGRGMGRHTPSDGYRQDAYSNPDWEAGPRRLRGGGGGLLGRGAFGRGPFSPHDTFNRDQTQPPPRKRTLLSAVAVDGEQLVPGGKEEPPHEEAPSLKRPAPSELEVDPAMRKRNRRMFGNLLGTLQRFKEDEKKFQQTETAQKQAEALKRAEEKAAADSQRLRQLERQKKVAERQGELDKIRQFNLQADLKALEIIYAKKILNRQRYQSFLLTKASPSLYWTPKTHTPETSAALLEQQDEFEKWKEQQGEELEGEKEKLREGAAARKAAAAARAQQMQERGGPAARQPTAEDEAVAKEEAELQKQLEEQRAERGEEGSGADEDVPAAQNGRDEAAAEAMDADGAVKGGRGEDEPNARHKRQSSSDAGGEGGDGEEDGELPDAGDDDQLGHDDDDGTGGDLLDTLDEDMGAGNPDAENIEDLLQ